MTSNERGLRKWTFRYEVHHPRSGREEAMAYLRPASDCNCETCSGGQAAKGPLGETVYGGWICACPCHKGGKKPDMNKSQPNALSFEKWFKENSPPPCRGRDYTAKNTVQAAWNHQQAIIDQLQRENAELRAIIKNAALERGLT